MKLPTYRFWLAASLLLSISKSPPSIRWSFYIETTKATKASSKFSSSAAMDSSTAGAMYGTSS